MWYIWFQLPRMDNFGGDFSCLPKCSNQLRTIVSFYFTNVSSVHKKEAEELGVSCFSWEEFNQLGSLHYELPSKQKTDICTIMNTSGTTVESEGVILNNAAINIIGEVLFVDHLLLLTDTVGTE